MSESVTVDITLQLLGLVLGGSSLREYPLSSSTVNLTAIALGIKKLWKARVT